MTEQSISIPTPKQEQKGGKGGVEPVRPVEAKKARGSHTPFGERLRSLITGQPTRAQQLENLTQKLGDLESRKANIEFHQSMGGSSDSHSPLDKHAEAQLQEEIEKVRDQIKKLQGSQ